MAKVYGKKQYVAKISKRKDGTGSYLKVGQKDFTLKAGQFLNLESVADQIKGLQEALEAGRLSEDVVTDRIAKLEKDKKEYGLLFDVTFQEITEK